MSGGRRDGSSWRWYAQSSSSRPSISVSEPSEDQIKERERRIRAGAQVVPFGFGRVLMPEPPAEIEPMVWEGDNA